MYLRLHSNISRRSVEYSTSCIQVCKHCRRVELFFQIVHLNYIGYIPMLLYMSIILRLNHRKRQSVSIGGQNENFYQLFSSEIIEGFNSCMKIDLLVVPLAMQNKTIRIICEKVHRSIKE